MFEKINRIDKTVVRKVRKQEASGDFAFWQTRSFEERLATLETIRQEYNEWKYGTQPGFKRVYSVIKR